jgi:hypothetical protein
MKSNPIKSLAFKSKRGPNLYLGKCRRNYCRAKYSYADRPAIS